VAHGGVRRAAARLNVYEKIENVGDAFSVKINRENERDINLKIENCHQNKGDFILIPKYFDETGN